MKNIILNLTLLTIAIISILSLNNCENNPCDTPANGENFILCDTIKTYLSNYQNAEKIIFSNEMGNEVEFNVSEFEDFNSEYQIRGICENDVTMNQTITGNSQTIQLFLANPAEISEPIFISLLEFPVPPNNIDVKEALIVTLGEWLSNSFDDGDELFRIRFNDVNLNIIFHDSLELNNNMFYSVYESENLSPTPRFEIKYTQNEGIIFIRDSSNGKEYTYERKE